VGGHPESHYAEINEAYRAIGRYTYCFSRVIYWMRQELENAVGNQHLAQIVTGEMAAYQIQAAFFGVCDERYDINETDRNIGRLIRKRVTSAIEFRNSLAHGDWLIGTHDGQGTTYPPILSRVRPGRAGGQWETVELTPADLDAKSDDLERLREDVYFYGGTAGGLFFQNRGYRPSDVFEIRDGVVVRDGTVKLDAHIS
jgi:hypothetical protein